MRTTFTYRFYCRNSKKGTDGKAPVELSIMVNSERKFVNLPWKERPEDFNKKRQSQEIRQLLAEWDNKIREICTDLLAEGMPLTSHTLRERIRTGGTKSYTLDNLFDDFLEKYNKRIGKTLCAASYKKMARTRDVMARHFDGSTEVCTFTTQVMENLYLDLQKEYALNTAASYFTKIKTIFQHAVDNGQLRSNPTSSVKIRREKKDIEYLTEEELDRISKTEFSTKALQRIADCFLVQSYSGLAFSDLEALKKDDIKTNDEGVYYIKKPRIKTGVEYTAVMFPQAIPILMKYSWKLPIISNQKTNSGLKAMAREAGIDKNVHSHLGRKTYGTLLINRGIRLETVAKCLGHSEPKTTAAYYAKILDKTVIDEVAKVF